MMNDKTGNIINEYESIKYAEQHKYAEVKKNNNKIDYAEPLKYDIIDFSSVNNPLYTKLNNNDNYFDISLQNNNNNNNNNNKIHYFDVSTLSEKEEYNMEEEDIFAVPSSFLKKEQPISNPVYFYGFENNNNDNNDDNDNNENKKIGVSNPVYFTTYLSSQLKK